MVTKSDVLRELKQHIQEELKTNNTSKRRMKLFAKLSNASEEDVIFGDYPEYFYAYLSCNSTGVGVSSFNGTETQRTVALDYDTDRYLFVDGHAGAAVKGLEIFFLEPGESVTYYKKSEIEEVAKDYGFNLHLQHFRDLNISLRSHRLNRCTVKVVDGPFYCTIRPIFISLMGKVDPVFIGYVYEKDGHEYIIIDFDDKSETNNKKSGCSGWMFLGFLFPPLLIVAIFVMLYRIIYNKK